MVIDKVRAALRDPFYRNECRQARFWRMLATWGLMAAGLAPLVLICAVCCCTLPAGAITLLFLLPALLGAESILSEQDRGTLEGLLLTPADRRRVVWAKALAWLRPLLWVALSLPVLALVPMMWMAARKQPDWPVVFPAALALSVLVIGQSFTGGAVGLVSALLGRTRMRSYLYSVLILGGISVVEFTVFAAAAWVIWMTAASSGGLAGARLEDAAVTAVLVGIGAVVFAARLMLVNMLLPAWILDYAARRMDELLLKES